MTNIIVKNISENNVEDSFFRSSLEYNHAFDLCAVEIHKLAKKVIIITDNKMYDYELTRRLPKHQPVVIPTSILCQIPSVKLKPKEITGNDPQIKIEKVLSNIQATIWAEPDNKNGCRIVKSISEYMQPGNYLFIIGSGYLSKYLPEWKVINCDRHLASILQCKKWLKDIDFEILEIYGIRTPVNFLFGLIARLWFMSGNKDVADYFYYKIREKLVVHGWSAIGSPVFFIIARKRKH